MPRTLVSRFKTNVLADGSLELTSFDATDYNASSLEIPAEISGRPVKALGDFFSADSGKTLTSVRLPAGLERIGDCAFADCKRLSSLVFPSSLAEVGVEAFEGCSALTQLVIPANVREIDFGAFARCTALAKIDVAPENTRFRSVDGVLFDAETKTLLAFPAGNDATVYVVPDGVERIAAKAFYGAERLVEIRLPASLRDVGVEAFGACASLTQIVIPEGVKKVGDRAFSDCSALSALRFPTSLETLGDEPFVGCAAQRFDVAPENPRFRSVDGVLFDAETKALLAFPGTLRRPERRRANRLRRVRVFAATCRNRSPGKRSKRRRLRVLRMFRLNRDPFPGGALRTRLQRVLPLRSPSPSRVCARRERPENASGQGVRSLRRAPKRRASERS